MEIFRLQNKVPETYIQQSRDFQVLCRLYDALIDDSKLSIDGILKTLDPFQCRDSVIPLACTKIGFFTRNEYNDVTLRYIISSLLYIVKNKGSLLSIKQAINLYLKIINFTSPIFIQYTEKAINLGGREIKDHTILIGLQTPLSNYDVLDDILRYILPIGISYEIIFFNSIEEADLYVNKESTTLLIISDSLSSIVKGTQTDYKLDNKFGYYFGGIDTARVISGAEMSNWITIPSGSLIANADYIFKGIVTTAPTTGSANEIYLYNDKEYIYLNNTWNMFDYKGISLKDSPTGYSINDVITIVKRDGLYIYLNNTFKQLNYLGQYTGSAPWANADYYSDNGLIYYPGDYVKYGTKTYKCLTMTSDNWNEEDWRQTPQPLDYYQLDDNKYYFNTNNTQVQITSITDVSDGLFPTSGMSSGKIYSISGYTRKYYNGTTWQDWNYPLYKASYVTQDNLLFNTSNVYNMGDLCIYNDNIYTCLNDNVTGDWDSSKWALIGELN